ncbi:MAG: sigma-E processing peptidase SpoIIGA, partial [Acutalibacteraceae bacterium]
MTEVVYADILIIVNTYVNYALLRLTGIICRKDTNRLRLALTAFFGSFYSFIILADFLPSVVIAVSRIVFAASLIVAAFKINSKRDFFRLFGIFFALNFAF